jgi:hypothetical protein
MAAMKKTPAKPENCPAENHITHHSNNNQLNDQLNDRPNDQLKASERPDILQRILHLIQGPPQAGLSRLAVFDLDSTLFDVSPRLQRVLDDFAMDPIHRKMFPEVLSFFQGIRTHQTDWGVSHALKRAGLEQSSSEFKQTMQDFWRRTFFSNEYLHHDIPFEGAVDFVQTLAHAGVEIIYLTGRDKHRMGLGSPEVLRKWNFPLDGKNSHLVLKPHRGMDDAEFKRDWFLDLDKTRYEIIWFFENEPVNIHLIRDDIPEIDIIFFDSTHSGRALEPEDLPRIRHFLIDGYPTSHSKSSLE